MFQSPSNALSGRKTAKKGANGARGRLTEAQGEIMGKFSTEKNKWRAYERAFGRARARNECYGL